MGTNKSVPLDKKLKLAANDGAVAQPVAAPARRVPPLFRKIDWLTLLITFGVVWAGYLLTLSPEAVRSATLAGDPIVARLIRAPGNDAPIGGLKVASEEGWFVARPSGTEDIVKLYAESFRDAAHLQRILDEAQQIMADARAG